MKIKTHLVSNIEYKFLSKLNVFFVKYYMTQNVFLKHN